MVQQHLHELDEIGRVMALYRRSPDFAAPESLIAGLKQLISSKEIRLFEN